jgi:hypothetical protein
MTIKPTIKLSAAKRATPAKPAKPALSTNTRYIDRVVEALTLLCAGAIPPREMVVAWEDDSSEELQSWAINHVATPWGTGIGTIEAAQTMADTPEEGMGHEYREDAFPREAALAHRDTSAADLSERITAAYGDDWSLSVSNGGNGSLTTDDTHYFNFIGELDDLIQEKMDQDPVPE